MARDRLKALDVERKKEPGRYADGGGLYLQVTRVKSGIAKSWILRYRLDGHLSKNGKPLSREMGLGPVSDISLAKAREKAAEKRALILDGKDPIETKRQANRDAAAERSRAQTFKQCAEAYVRSHWKAWKNPKHRQQWENTLETYCYPVFGDLHVKAIDTALVMRVLEPLWTSKPETASRIRGRIERVLDCAKVQGLREGECPARWKGHLDKLLPALSKVRKVKHHAALRYAEIGAFMTELREREAIAARALEFRILTAARTGEVIGARWNEIDLAGKVWTVPEERMKGGREHRVPLSDAAVKLLKDVELVRENDTDFIFPGSHRERISNMAMEMLLRRMNLDVTVHGFRSSFRDWAAERSTFPREVAEAALAHINGDKTEAAYQRGDMFEKRRRLMDGWANYCAKVPATNNVTPLRVGATR